MRVVITGANGFVGSSIVKSLSSQFEFSILPSRFIVNDTFVRDKLSNCNSMVHLAGISSVSDCEKNPRDTYQINVGLTCYLAEMFFQLNQGGHFIFTSTAQVYDEQEPMPHNENTKLAPLSVYARSKLSAEVALTEVAKHLKGRLTLLRLYNFTHKTQSNRFVLPSILKQIQDSKSELVQIKVGNLEINRDFSSIQDLVAAFRAIFLCHQVKSEIETYNLSSGVDKNLRQVIIGVAERMGKRIEFEIDPSRIRTSDPIRIVGDSEKFKRDFNWISRSQTIPSFLDLFLEDL